MKRLDNVVLRLAAPLLFLVAICILSLSAQYQSPSKVLNYTEGRFVNKKEGIILVLDLKKEKLQVPGYEFLGEVPGYLYGEKSQNIYGYWFVTDIKYLNRDSSKIALKFMSDSAADPQHIVLHFKSDSVAQMKLENGIEMRRQVGQTRKLEKINGAFELVRE